MDDDNNYKSCATAIFLILITALASLILSILATSCHSHKVVAQRDTTSLSVQAAVHDSIATASRVQWMNSLNLELDSFEILLPYHLIAGNRMTDGQYFAADDVALAQEQPHWPANTVVLRGKRAKLGRADVVSREESLTTTHRDTVAATAQHGAQLAKDIDTTGIAKPPNMDWIIGLAIVAAAAVLLVLGYAKYIKR